MGFRTGQVSRTKTVPSYSQLVSSNPCPARIPLSFRECSVLARTATLVERNNNVPLPRCRPRLSELCEMGTPAQRYAREAQNSKEVESMKRALRHRTFTLD